MVKIPEPKPGRVIRYEYLWRRQALRGQDTAEKDRPACIIVAVHRAQGDTRVLLLPITRSAPTGGDAAYEIPLRLKEHLGLDADRSWIVLSEANIDIWPSPDLRPIPGRPGVMEYGLLPQKLVNALREAVLNAILAKRMQATDREAADPTEQPDLSDFTDGWQPSKP
ncbi:MAG TPA: hypothetical protein VD978_17295 [Azospirillum sp.]|nr:hypothetical protein [Azospirillum sp.]